MTKQPFRFTFLLLICVLIPLTATAQTVNIPDPNLRAAIEKALGKASGASITAADMAKLIELTAQDANISDLTGLEYATNLTGLYLGAEWVEAERNWINSNSISNLSPLAGLTNLRELDLANNSISDISTVARLTNLTRLELMYNSISDISAVAGLTNLSTLRLYNNSISDISALAGLTNLTWLELWNNDISDISAVVGLTNLTWMVLGSNAISDISAVAGLTNLSTLRLYNNSISDISALAGLTKLTSLHLGYNTISDISALVANAGFGNEDRVYLWGNPLSYQSIHTHIPALQARGVTVEFDNRTLQTLLKISGTVTPSDNLLIVEIRDSKGVPFEGIAVTFTVTSGGGTLSATTVMTDTNGRAQTTLTLGSTGEPNNVEASVTGVVQTVTFSDVPEPTVNIPDPNLRAAIENALGKASGATITTADMAKLTRLDAPNANISNLTGLEHATNLTNLDLSGEYMEAERRSVNSNSVSDLSPLSGLTKLRNLWLPHNAISDLSPVTGLTNLTSLFLWDNLISDLSPVTGLTNLRELYLGNNSISDISAVAGLTNLTRLGIGNNNISDISAVAGLTNLTFLSLSNAISDISPVSGLTNLTELWLYSNAISDISPVSGLTNLTRLWLYSNAITDISAVAGLTNLTSLELWDNDISDISPLVANTGLGSGDIVNVQRNPLNRASIKTHIPALQSRGVIVNFDNVITESVNIPDANLRAAIEKELGKASGDTITTADMANLTRLEALNANISNLTGLEAATNLRWLDLGTEYVEAERRYINSNSISDLSPLVNPWILRITISQTSHPWRA